jgi:hypothetical protein
MLPFGSLTPHPGWGDPRESRLTHDEERTEFTLWAISRSPLILGANLTKLDDFTRSLITNKDVTEMDQTVVESHDSPSHGEGVRIWTASTAGEHPKVYVAAFNVGENASASLRLHCSFDQPALAPLQREFQPWAQAQLALCGRHGDRRRAARAERLNKQGMLVTLDSLGESVTTEIEAQKVGRCLPPLLDAIAAQEAQTPISA